MNGGGSPANPLSGTSITATEGNLLETNSIMLQAMYEDVDGDSHLLLEYMPPDYANILSTLVDVNLTDGTHVVATSTKGRPCATGSSKHPASGVIYLGHDDPAWVSAFDPATGNIEVIAGPTTRGPSNAIAFGADDFVWWGGLNGTVFSYDPATKAFVEWGEMASDADLTYSLACDPANTHVYAALAYTPWRLASLDRATGIATLYFDGEGDTFGEVLLAADDSACYYRRLLVDGTTWKYYSLIGGVVTEVESVPAAKHYGFYTSPPTWEPTFGYEIDLSAAIPLSASADATLRYRVTAGEWQEVTLSGFTTSAVTPFRAVRYDDNRLCVAPSAYFPVVLYNPSTGLVEPQGWTTASLYRLLQDSSDIYLCGYHDAFLQWDTTQPWTLYHNSIDTSTTNPRSVASGGKSHQYVVKDSEGAIWTLSMHVRTSNGSSIVRYDPVADTYTKFREAWGLEDYGGSGLAAAGDCIVASLRHNDGSSAGRIIVIDIADNSLALDAVQTGVIDPGFLLPLDATHVFAIADYAYYRLDITTGEKDRVGATGSKMFPAATYVWLRGAQVGADGRIWLMCGTDLYAIDPVDGVMYQAVQNVPSAQRGEVVWLGDTPYLLGSTHIHKINLPE